MIYDAFPFFNELELLELRLQELDPVVDKFVLAEATVTHSNKPKPLYFQEHRHEFKRFAHKIIHVVVDDMPDHPNPWVREEFQRDAVARGLTQCRPDDILLLSDVDEIPRASTLREVLPKMKFCPGAGARFVHSLLRPRWLTYIARRLLQKYHPFVWVFDQSFHLYYLNCVAKTARWSGTRMAFFRDLARPNDLRRWGGKRVLNGGWHFSYMGGIERIQTKLDSYAHQEYNKEKYSNADWLAVALKEGRHIFRGTPELRFEAVDDTYPAYLRANLPRYSGWIRDLE